MGKESPCILCKLKRQYLAHMPPTLVPIVSQMNPIHTAQPNSFKDLFWHYLHVYTQIFMSLLTQSLS